MFKFSKSILLCILLFSANFAVAVDEVQDANKLFKKGQYAQALEKVDGFLTSKPKDAQARFLKGLILTEQGHTNEAIKIFSDLTDDYPELPEPYNNLAVLYAGQGQYEKAKVALEMAIRTHPSYATAHENLGDIYAKMASQAYDRALQLDRNNTTTQTKLELIKELFSNKIKATRPVVVTAAASAPIAAVNAAATAPGQPAVVAPAIVAPVIAAAPAGSSAVVPAKPVANSVKPAVNPGDEALKTVNDWAAAWSARNVKAYLAFYASEFKTPDGENRSAWEAQRRERIAAPKSIQVQISDAKVNVINDSHVSVTFKQHYHASHLNSVTVKTLALVKANGSWLIESERSGR